MHTHPAPYDWATEELVDEIKDILIQHYWYTFVHSPIPRGSEPNRQAPERWTHDES